MLAPRPGGSAGDHDSSHFADPWSDAEVAWHMATPIANERYPLELAVCGAVRLGQRLHGDESSASIQRGGNGLAATLEGGYLALDTYRARRLRPSAGVLSIHVRAWIEAESSGGLFFSDFAALAVHSTGLAIGFLGTGTAEGKVFRELPLGFIPRGQWLDLVLRVADGAAGFFCNGLQICSIPQCHRLCAPFDDELLIGAWKCSKPDLYGTATPRPLADCRIDSVALWHRALRDEEIAMLSGVERVEHSGSDAGSQALLDYNVFFDASVQKEVASCERLWQCLRVAAGRDRARPIYHLTQPLGHIFDPCGAFFHDGRYHVYSYRNIYARLEYSSLDHYVSDDLVHWRGWPTGPWADSIHDVFCIYLMNHFVDDQGTLRALYTGQGVNGKFGVLARSDDGLVSHTDKKAVLNRYHHDGHVWKEGETWYTITARMCRATRPGNLGDAVMLWSSRDLEHWQELGEIFAQPRLEEGTEQDQAGFMEFPYLLSFGDKDVLMLGGHPVRYWVGRFQRQRLEFIPDETTGRLLDHANPFHCFNPLCEDRGGSGGAPRRIIMALYSELAGGGSEKLPWNGVHVMPRSLELDGERLVQRPLPELQALRGPHQALLDVDVAPGTSGYISQRGDAVEIAAEFEPAPDGHRFGLVVCASADGIGCVRVYYDVASGDFGVEAQVAGGAADEAAMPTGRGPAFVPPGRPVRLHVFLDKGLVEVFVEGETCTTAAPESLRQCDGLDLFSEGGIARCTALDIWSMRSAFPEDAASGRGRGSGADARA